MTGDFASLQKPLHSGISQLLVGQTLLGKHDCKWGKINPPFFVCFFCFYHCIFVFLLMCYLFLSVLLIKHIFIPQKQEMVQLTPGAHYLSISHFQLHSLTHNTPFSSLVCSGFYILLFCLSFSNLNCTLFEFQLL